MDFTNKIIFSIIFFFGVYTQAALSQNVDEKKALEDFETIESQNRYVESLNIGSGEQEGKAYNLPIGIKKIIGNIPFTLAITNVKFGNEYGQATVIMKMRPTQTSKTMVFGATDVTISYNGDLVGDITLALLSDIPISLGNMGQLTLKGGFDNATGTSTSKTYVSLDCNGSFKELSVAADITLNENIFKEAGKTQDELVSASFRTVVSDWNDLFVEVNIPPFEIKGADGFEFTLANAALDLSDYRNPQTFNPDPEYFQKFFTLPDQTLWRGLYVDKFSVTFPEWFKVKGSNERITLEASRLLIDDNGITGDILGHNILPFEKGDAGGWAFSVTDFRLSFLANNIKGFGFGGEIDIPLSGKSQPRTYEAYISKNEYLFKVSLGADLDCNIFGAAKLNIDPTSYLQIHLKDKRFSPRVVLNGSMGFNADGLEIEELTFTKLAIGTESPILSVESMGYGGELKFNNFPISISDIRASLNENLATFGFDAHINLMSERISASSRINIASERKEEKWSFKGVSIDALRLNNVQMAGFSLNGEIRIEKDHPTYGNYFGGLIKVTFGSLSNELVVDVASVFGRKDFRYWYVEGQAAFKRGIPIGPFMLNGFTGGAYYRMAATGGTGLQAYAPDDSSSLGVKAGVSYGIGANLIKGQALFEMNFLSSGGVKNMKFYGTAEFFAGVQAWIEIEGLDKLRKEVQQKNKILSKSLSTALPQNMSGSDVAKDVLVSVKLGMGINAYLTMDYDFVSRTFDADFRLMVTTTGNFIKGAGNNNEAGWTKLHFSPHSWYVHAGTPTNPIGLKIGLGPLSLTSESYIMLGDKLENPAAPPQQVLDILRITQEKADYMKFPADMQAGRGVAFGSHLSFDTGDLRFLILYARFMAGAGFDLMLRDMSNYACEGKSSSVGINGWYANGQCYAYLQGELGVRIKLLFINKRITIIKGATAALLQARFPNPTWIGGRLAVRLNVLGGLIKANMSMKMSFGDDCKLVSLNGDDSPLDMPVIADLSPLSNDTDVDVFLSPQATFNMAIEEPFDVMEDSGDTKKYRLKLGEFYITDNKSQKVEGNVKWNKDKNAATFESKEILPPHTDMKVFVSVNFEEYVNGNWRLVTHNGNTSRESRESAFKTGGAPNYIPLTNIEYCYPVINQNNFFKDESPSGYVQLKKGQSYLFPDNFAYNTLFTGKSGKAEKIPFLYNKADSRLNYQFSDIKNKTNYEISFVASTIAQGQSSVAETKTTTSTIKDDEGESFSIDYMQQAAQKIIKDGNMEVLNYAFRSSLHNTFEQKMSSASFNPSDRYVNTDIRSLLLTASKSFELFDEAELIGSDYTAGVPLVSLEAVLDDAYYTKDIAPILYNWYPAKGISISRRDVGVYGAPPAKAFPILDGYLNYIMSDTYNESIAKRLPFVYELPYYYNQDYYELLTKAVNSFDKGIDLTPVMPLIESDHFPFIRKGNYKTKMIYILPGGKQGTSKQINYEQTLDWR